MNNEERKHRYISEIVIGMRDALSEEGISVRFHVSQRQVPMLIVKDDYSVAYFASTRTYRIFHPFPSNGRDVTRTTVPEKQDVINFFLNRPYETVGLKECVTCARHVRIPHLLHTVWIRGVRTQVSVDLPALQELING